MANTKKDWNGPQHEALAWLDELLEEDDDPNIRELAAMVQDEYGLTVDEIVAVVEQSSFTATSETLAEVREALS